jgi:hypothetical protein
LSVVALIEFYFKLIICITIPEEPEKWNRENPDPVPYAVVVRLEDTTQTADVYVEVQNIMAQLEVQARSNI